jgi:C4-dicarboxylate-specific signal transduction histidine kinase
MLRALFSGLQGRFLALILLAILPGFGWTFYVGFEQRRQAMADAKEDALQLARVTAANQARLFEAERQLLATIAALPEVLGGDAVACNTRLADLHQQYPRYANLTVVTPDGETSCSALPFTPPVSVAQRSWFQRATQTRTFVVGDYQVGTITGKATINLAYPILGAADQIRAIVSAALDLGWLNQLLAEAQPPEGPSLSIVDRTGTIVARSPDTERWIGQSLPEAPIVRTVLAQGAGTADLADLDGVARLFAFKQLVGSGRNASLYMVVGIPKAAVFAEAD